MTKRNKKEKTGGQEKHRELVRIKKMQRKQRKNVDLPARHRKGK